MAKDLDIFNLSLIVTEQCNLNCGHCMRGCSSDSQMSDEVINATLDQVSVIGCLSICGGEPLYAIKQIDKIFKRIIQNRIYVEEINLTTNATIYSDEFMSIVNYMDKYLRATTKKENSFYIAVSNDFYHEQEIKRLNLEKVYLENVKKYAQTKYFVGFQRLLKKPFSEGNADSLDKSLTVPLRPMETFITYTNDGKKFDKDGMCHIGSVVTVNVDGTVTEADASIANQESLYNYGNVLEDSIEDIMLKKATLVLKPKNFEKLVEKERKRYLSYNK